METSHDSAYPPSEALVDKETQRAARRLLQQPADEHIAAAPAERAAIFLCPHPPEDDLMSRKVAEANALRAGDRAVHFCCRQRPKGLDESIVVHELGAASADSVIEQALDFADRAAIALSKRGSASVHGVVFGSEWSSVPALKRLARAGVGGIVLSLDSLECQRSDMASELNRAIENLEIAGLQSVQQVLVSNDEVAGHVRRLVPDAEPKLQYAYQPFPVDDFASNLDPGQVKARYQIGPVDPTILFVGEMNWQHGPDILVKAMPALLRNHGHMRAVFVGDGDLCWPVRVQARYMLIEHAVRLLGHREGRELHELIAAADIVVIPSRERTEDWLLLAAWAAKRPVVATHATAGGLSTHEDNAALVYPNPGSCVWGVERVLYDPDLAHKLGERGRTTLEHRFGWPRVAAQLGALVDDLSTGGRPDTRRPQHPRLQVEAEA